MNAADLLTPELLAELHALPGHEFVEFFRPLKPEDRDAIAGAYYREYRPTLYQFVRAAWSTMFPSEEFIDGPHIKAICDHLQAVSEGKIEGDTVLNVPPGHAKSTLCNIAWPVWVWGPAGRPETGWLFNSHSEELVMRDSLRRRNLMDSDWFKARWSVTLADDQNRKRRYENSAGGWMYSTTVGGQGTGEHPDFIVIDDPHDTHRGTTETALEDVRSWWREKMSSRGIGKGVKRVLVMQRVDILDLAGVWLEDEKTVHLCLPFEFEPGRMKPTPIGFQDWRTKIGEKLWPQFFTPEKEARLRRGMTPAVEAAQLQQRPPKQKGGADWPAEYFDQKFWIHQWAAEQYVEATVLSLDPSLGRTETSDYAAFTINKRCLIGERVEFQCTTWLERMDPFQMARKTVEIAKEFNPNSVVIEANGFQAVLQPMIQDEARKAGILLPIRGVTSSKNKRERVLSDLTPLFKESAIKFLFGVPANELTRQQLEGFPVARYDDGPDSVAMSVREHLRLWSGEEEDEVERAG